MPTKKQYQQMLESQFEFPETRRTDDPMYKTPKVNETESTPTHGRTAEEIEALAEKIIWADKTVATGDVKHEKNGFVKGYNQAMEEHRTQPQEVREEVECTHPYKECVMSDRVNKYGTPLTKCSVCGNDNICDEE